MIQTGIESRVKIQDVISSQLPNFILDESPTTVDFLKQYYISQEFKSGVVDIAENLDQYLDLDNLTPEIITDNATLSVGIGTQDVGIVTVPYSFIQISTASINDACVLKDFDSCVIICILYMFLCIRTVAYY